MRVAVLGGGLQGCCVALALAERGARVTLLERSEALLSRAAVANEGKIHLGYTYGSDPSLRTARMMIEGAFAFAPFFERYVGLAVERIQVSSPCVYVVHRNSQRGVAETASYLASVHNILIEAARGRPGAYFGVDLPAAPPLRWSTGELDTVFDPARILAAFTTPEIAVVPDQLAASVQGAVDAHPAIEVRLRTTVVAVQEGGARLTVISEPGDRHPGSYDHVVNALWDGRMAVDSTLGIKPERSWLHRFKYGVRFRIPDWARRPPTTTVVLGPFGDVVNYGDGAVYVSWYPECMREMSSDVAPPSWPVSPPEPIATEVWRSSLAALAEIVLPLRDFGPLDISDARVKGGVITAWAHSDIDDPRSGLHCRSEVGIFTNRTYHSIDPGKLTMAPYFAELCADRILPQDRRQIAGVHS